MIVMVVEDEFFIGRETSDSLLAMGHSVLGPIGTVDEALRALADGPLPDAAIVDINLRGVCSLAVAEELKRHRIPFAFTTGYGDDPGLQRRFEAALWLRKPYSELQIRGLLASMDEGTRPS